MKLACLCQQAAYNESFLSYMKVTFGRRRFPRACNNNGPKLIEQGHRNSFQSRAVRVFNELPKELRETDKQNIFRNNARKYFMNKAKERLL